ncbi:MAG: hypothetical protein ABS46_04775 [Cytophagaceae bacterium SCN 52-12]|nr:MAG: hypothetical protein ABS46_04775 [Cytophagaceae bacterium SCN 52-12]
MRNLLMLLALVVSVPVYSQDLSLTYAERLGFPKGKKVVILHIDDAGMSYDSNLGTERALKEGVANSVSVMMPCGWVPGFVHFLKENKDIDAGLHLTLTSEWTQYRWGPLAGKPMVRSLVDREGALWPSVKDVVKNGSAEHVETEIRAQLERARTMGFEPTHMDSHMGTLFATPEFLQRYIKVGIEEKIPVMLPGGHNTLIKVDERLEGEALDMIRKLGRTLWDAGLPVLDDLHNTSYGWVPESADRISKAQLQKYKADKYIRALKEEIQPGLTMVIMHCTHPTEVFSHISSSGATREGDLLAMLDPRLRKAIEEEGVILTTWREIMERRGKVK